MTISASANKLGLHNSELNRHHNIRVALIADKLSDAVAKVDEGILGQINEVLRSAQIKPIKRSVFPDEMRDKDGGYHLQHDYLGQILDHLDESITKAPSKSDQNNSPTAIDANIEASNIPDIQRAIDTISKIQSSKVPEADAQLIKDISEILGIRNGAVQGYASFLKLSKQIQKEHNAAHSAELPSKIDKKLATALLKKILLHNKSYNALSPSEQSDSFFHSLGKTRKQAIESLRIFLNIGNNPKNSEDYKIFADEKYISIIENIYGQFLTDKNNNPQSQALLEIEQKLSDISTIKSQDTLRALIKQLAGRKEPEPNEVQANSPKYKEYLTLSTKAVNLQTQLRDYLETHWKNSATLVERPNDGTPEFSPIASAIAAFYDAKIIVHTHNPSAGQQIINEKGERDIELLCADQNGKNELQANHYLRLIPITPTTAASNGNATK